MQAELDEIAAFANTYGYNAIFFEAVPECDAFYQSEILPSQVGCGEYGKSHRENRKRSQQGADYRTPLVGIVFHGRKHWKC